MDNFQERFVYIKSGNYSIPLFIGVPGKREKKCPAVIFCHGFGGTKSEVYRHFVRLSCKLRNAGFLTVRFDFAGFGDSLAPTTAFSISQGVEDIKSIVELLKKEQEADLNYLNILGFSLGSLIASEAIGAGIPARSLCLVCPVEHYVVHKDVAGEEDAGNSSIWYNGYELSPLFVDEYIKSKGAVNFVDRNIPVQLIQGSDDQTVPLSHYEEYKKVIDSKKVEPLLVTGGDHTFSKKKFQDLLDDKVLCFFKFHNNFNG